MIPTPHEPIPASSSLDAQALAESFEAEQTTFDTELAEASGTVALAAAYAAHAGRLRVLLAQGIARLRSEEDEKDGAVEDLTRAGLIT